MNMTIHKVQEYEGMCGNWTISHSTSMVDHCRISLTNFVPKQGFELFVILLFRGQFGQQVSTGAHKFLLYSHKHQAGVERRHSSVGAVNGSGVGAVNPLTSSGALDSPHSQLG